MSENVIKTWDVPLQYPVPMKYMIYNMVDNLFWNENKGWGNLADAGRWELSELEKKLLPVSGHWVDELIAYTLPQGKA